MKRRSVSTVKMRCAFDLAPPPPHYPTPPQPSRHRIRRLDSLSIYASLSHRCVSHSGTAGKRTLPRRAFCGARHRRASAATFALYETLPGLISLHYSAVPLVLRLPNSRELAGRGGAQHISRLLAAVTRTSNATHAHVAHCGTERRFTLRRLRVCGTS